MLQTITEFVVSVTPRTVTRKRDQRQITLYEVEFANGIRATAARREIGAMAQSLVGQQAEAYIEVKQDGQYTNNYLQSIGVPTGFAPAQQAQQAFVQQHPANQPVTTGFIQPQTNGTTSTASFTMTGGSIPASPREGEGTTKDWSIWRQTATKVAAHISKTQEEFWQNVDDLIEFYRSGDKPPVSFKLTPSQQTETAQAMATYQPHQQNQFIPEAAIRSELDQAPPPDDSDIPF